MMTVLMMWIVIPDSVTVKVIIIIKMQAGVGWKSGGYDHSNLHTNGRDHSPAVVEGISV